MKISNFLFIILTICFISCKKNKDVKVKSQILTIQPGPTDGQDGEVSSITPDRTYTNGNFLNPYAWTQGGILNKKRTFIKFDISTIPSNAIIDSAYLSLYFSQALVNAFPTFTGHSGDNELTIQRISSGWALPSLTWNTQPTSSPVNQLIVPPFTSITQNYLNINVKGMVDDMKNLGNNGFLIKHTIENPLKITCLTSSEESNPLIRPKLVVYYH